MHDGASLDTRTPYLLPMEDTLIYNVSTELAYFGSYALVFVLSVTTMLLSFRVFNRRKALMRALVGKPLPEEKNVLALIRQFGHVEIHEAGTVLFQKGDNPDQLFIIDSGDVMLEEIEVRLGKDDILGELGVFTPGVSRTCSAVCKTRCVTHTLPYETLLRLYEKHPRVGLFLMRLVAERLLQSKASFIPCPAVISHSETQPGCPSDLQGVCPYLS